MSIDLAHPEDGYQCSATCLTALLITNGDAGLCIRMRRGNSPTSADPRVASHLRTVAGSSARGVRVTAPSWARPVGVAGYQPGSGSWGGGLVLFSHARRDTPTIADRDALVLRPRPDVRAALTARYGPPRPAP